MLALSKPQGLLAGGVVFSAAASGLLLARSGNVGTALLASLVFASFVVVVVEAPIVGFIVLGAILGLAPEIGSDDRLLGLSSTVYGSVAAELTPPLILLALLAGVLALSVDDPWWPGHPATLASALLVVALANVVWFSPLAYGLAIVRPVIFLVLAILVGYWISLRYGTKLPLVVLVGSGVLALPGGIYNAAVGSLSYYDASFVYTIGMAALLAFFRVVDIGYFRLPFVILAVAVIGLSTRRGATLSIVIAFLITALFFSRGKLRTALAFVLAALVVVELAIPGVAVSRAEELASFYAGTAGERAVYAREWESANAWLNIRDNWLFGIGPTALWTLFDTAGGNFRPSEEFRHYLHNSYQWVWLRYGLAGLILFVAFLAVSARALIRRSAPVICVIVGGSFVGVAVGLVTGAWLTTTVRWPLSMGLFLGIGLAAMREHRIRGASSSEQNLEFTDLSGLRGAA